MKDFTKNLIFSLILVASIFTTFPKPAIGTTTIFSDNFGSSYTTLASHVPTTTGTGYTLLINNGVLITVQSYNNHATVTANTANAGSFYTLEGTYVDADYEISSNIAFAGGDSNYTRSMGLRVQDANNMYLLRYGGTTMVMYKRVSGTWTTIGTASGVNLVNNLVSPYIGQSVSFSAIGTTLTAKVDGVTKLTVTDSSITGTGKAGIGLGYVNVSTDDGGTGVGIDNVLVQTASSDTTAPTITSVSSDKTNGSYTTGEVIDIDVTFSETVTSTGNVTVTLETGDTDRTCTFTVTSASTGTCNYTVQAGDTADDLTVNSISGTIADTNSNAMSNFVPTTNLAANKALVVDTTSPTVSAVSASPSTTSAIITWTSDESTSSLVNYGLTSSFGSSTSESDTSPRVTSHTVTVSNILPCSIYYFQAVSKDAATNQGASNASTFTTTGCAGSATVSAQSSSSQIDKDTGGSASLTSDSRTVNLTIPVGYSGTSAYFQIKQIDKASVINSISTPTNFGLAGDLVYDFKALTAVDTQTNSFSQPITVSLTYTDSDVVGLDQSTLVIYQYDSAWTKLSNCSTNLGTKTVTCTTTNFSTFALFGQSSSSSSNSSSQSSSVSSNIAPVCGNSAPVGSPDLFQINTSSSSASLFFTPIRGVQKYHINYGNSPQAEEYGAISDFGDKGVQVIDISLLPPNKTFYFKVRGQNGCMPGKWGNVMKVTTSPMGFKKSRIFYK